MNRISVLPRKDWQKKVESLGFDFHTIGDQYWDESAYYEFEMEEVEHIEKATIQLWDMCLEAVEHVIKNKKYDLFHIPEWFVPQIEKSWEGDEPSIYGRFDFQYNNGQLKLLEFNADTPTSLFEASIVQWFWLQDRFPEKDQFNSIHEKLIAYWSFLKTYLNPGVLHLTSVRDSAEDYTTVRYLQDCAIQAGLETSFLYIAEIGWDSQFSLFVDQNDLQIRNIFKLYPYEWLLHEEFGKNIVEDKSSTFWIEPAWKMILSNKALLPLLWELFPYHPYLLKCYHDSPREMTSWCEKPILSREGANINLVKNGKTLLQSDGEYGEEAFVYQELAELAEFDGNYALIGSWIIGQESAGIGIRESKSLITDNTSRFIPHIIS
ncbi:MAG: glutathionylspermidine synthase family protein [Saprospiraceae bacterium]